jgi:hypothetical protein
MRNKLVICCLVFALSPMHLESQSANPLHAPGLAESTCGKAHGWMRISTQDLVGDFSCFSPEINGGYASIGAGGVNGRDDISIQMNFLSRPGTHSCKVPTLVIEFQENRKRWDAYRVENAKFGDCTITQTFENGQKLWKGRATASLVIVKGDTAVGSPRKLHTEKDSSGNPITKIVELEWEFDQLFHPTGLSPDKK